MPAEAAIAGRAIAFMSVGILFRLFGAPIKAVIDKHLGKVTVLFIALVIGGFAAVTLLGGEGDKTNEKCASATEMPA